MEKFIETLGMFIPRADSLLLQLFSVLILFTAMTTLLYNPVSQFMAGRRERIAKQLENAKDQEESAYQLKGQFESQLKSVQIEAQKFMEEAKKRAAERETILIHEAEQKAKNIIEKAHKEVEVEKEKVRLQMKEEMIDMAFVIAQNIMQKTFNHEEKSKAIYDFIHEVGNANESIGYEEIC